MDKDEKLYFDKTESFNSMIELFKWNEIQISYGGHNYNITSEADPNGRNCACVANNDEDLDLIEDKEERGREYYRRARYFDTYEEMLLNFKFPDGRGILDVLSSDDFECL